MLPINSQSSVNTGHISGLSISVPYQFSPSSGSLLVAILGIEKNYSLGVPNGFSTHSSGGTNGANYLVASRVADGTETALDFTTTAGTRGAAYALLEFPAGASLETAVSSFDDSSETTASVTSFPVGPVQTGGDDRTVIAAWFNDSLGALAGNTPVWSDGFTPIASNEGGTETGHPGMAIAYLESPTDSSISSTLSYTGGTADDGIATLFTVIDPPPLANVAPVADDATFSINDEVANGHVVGTYTATDSDGTVVSYSITGTQLAIDNAGQITVIDNTGLTAGVPIVETVTAADDDGDTGTAIITVNVTPPELAISNVSTITPLVGGQITFNYSNAQGALTAGDYTISSQNGTQATIDIFDPVLTTLAGDTYPTTPYQADTIIPITDGVTTVNLTIQIQIGAAEELGTIAEVDADGAYANDVGVAIGQTVHVKNNNNIVFDIATGLGTSTSVGGSLEYAIYDGEWSSYVTYDIPAFPASQVTIDDLVVARNSATVTFSYSGTDVTSYEYNIGGGWVAASSPQAISGLTEDTLYTLQIRPLLSGSPGAITSVDFTTSPGVDVTPNPISDQTVSNAGLSSVVTFNAVTVLGIDAGTDILATVTNGEFRVSTDGGQTWGAWSTADQNVRLNYQIQARHTASDSNSTNTATVLNIGGEIVNLTSVTLGDAIAPVIYPNVSSPYEVEIGSVWIDPQATVIDNADASRQISADQLVDTGSLGSTVIDYNATDAAGNVAQTVQLTVNVVNSAPAQTYTYSNDADSLVVDMQGNPENVTFDTLEVWTRAPEENGSVVTRFNNLQVVDGRFTLNSSLVQQGVTYLLIGRDGGNLPANYIRAEGQFQ